MTQRMFLMAGCLVLCPLVARAAAQSSRQFVEALYTSYSQQDAGSTLGKRADAVFSPTLLAEIRADQTAHAGEVGKLDHDPLCACQDSAGLKVEGITVTPLPNGSADASVRFTLGEVAKSAQLRLTDTPAGWRVDDVSTPGMPSLRRFLVTP